MKPIAALSRCPHKITFITIIAIDKPIEPYVICKKYIWIACRHAKKTLFFRKPKHTIRPSEVRQSSRDIVLNSTGDLRCKINLMAKRSEADVSNFYLIFIGDWSQNNPHGQLWPTEVWQFSRNFSLYFAGDLNPKLTTWPSAESFRMFGLNRRLNIKGKINHMANSILFASRNIDFIHFLPEWGKWKLNFRAIPDFTATPFPISWQFPGCLPVWKVNQVANQSESEALEFLLSNFGWSKIKSCCRATASQKLWEFSFWKLSPLSKVILYFTEVI